MKNVNAHPEFVKLKRQLVSREKCQVESSSEMFRMGYRLDQSGYHDEAEVIYRETADFLESLLGDEKELLSERVLSRIAGTHGRALFKLGKFHHARIAFVRAIEILESLIECDASLLLVDDLASAHNWLARTLRKIEEVSLSKEHYRKAIKLFESMVSYSSAEEMRDKHNRSLALSFIGYSKCLEMQGSNWLAESYRESAEELLTGQLPEQIIQRILS